MNERAIRDYCLGWNASDERWELRLRFGQDTPEDNLVARSIPGEGKDDFERICREYVRHHSVSAMRTLPRRLAVNNMEGEMIEQAYYDVDSMRD